MDVAEHTSGAVNLWLRSGNGLLLEFHEAGFEYTLLEASPVGLSLDLGFPDVAAAARELGDFWLERVLRNLLEQPTVWNRTAALGLFVRLSRHSAGRPARELLSAAFPADVRHDVDVKAFRWARGLRHHELVWQKLMALDHSTAPLVGRLGADVRIDDEHLRRIAEGDPWAWGAVLAREL